jgi:hypothetical protein
MKKLFTTITAIVAQHENGNNTIFVARAIVHKMFNPTGPNQ